MNANASQVNAVPVLNENHGYNDASMGFHLLVIKCRAMELKEFDIQRLTNGKGDSHLVVITEPAIEDMLIGTVIIVPYADGFKDPVKVKLQVDKEGNPKLANDKFAIVSEYIYK